MLSVFEKNPISEKLNLLMRTINFRHQMYSPALSQDSGNAQVSNEQSFVL
jgi:hypothetical protein